MFNQETFRFELGVHEHFVFYNGEIYDFFYNKITLNYVDVEIEEVVKKYLFRMKPDFKCYIGGMSYCTKEKLIDGKLCYPTPRKLDTIQSELYFKRRNVPNHIEEVSHIAGYVDNDDEPYSLYLFKCRPHAYCDTKGHIFYDFDPDNVVL